ncbi:MAG TPA: hypothetical protein VKE94_02435 [Gemmataceae bacterium]|nr:hypothetical protein [Gemmataceae bacterium]
MKRLELMLGFTTGCVVAGLCAWAVTDLRAQTQPGIHVCIATDGVMRLATGDTCPPNQQSVYFQKAEGDLDDAKPDSSPCASEARRIAALERQIKELEDAGARGDGPKTVVAPFEVVDRSGKRVFLVDAEGDGPHAEIYNSAGVGVARMWALPSGGQFMTQASSGPGSSTYFGVFADGKANGLRILDAGKTRLNVGQDEANGRYLLKVFNKSGKPVAAIGENNLGTGTAQVADAEGRIRADLLVLGSGQGAFNIYNATDKIVAQLTEGSSSGGLFQIYDADGKTQMVEAGISDGVGIVRAGPNGFKPGVGLLGLPGSYIMGKK